MDFAESTIEEIFQLFSENSDEILKIWPKIGHFLTLKSDLARCVCGMNMVDGALKYLWLVLLFSEMSLNLGSNLEKFEGAIITVMRVSEKIQ